MSKRIDPELTRRARELRNNPTVAERLIWQRVSRYRPAFTRQLIVAPCIMALLCNCLQEPPSASAAPTPTPPLQGGERKTASLGLTTAIHPFFVV